MRQIRPMDSVMRTAAVCRAFVAVGSVLTLASCSYLLGRTPSSAPQTVAYEVFDSYYVSNKFRPNEPLTLLVISDQKRFDDVFGPASVMFSKQKWMPKDAFDSKMVAAVIRRGNAVWTYQVEALESSEGILTLRFQSKSTPGRLATFACPLLVALDRASYAAVRFVENGKELGKVRITKGQGLDVAAPRR